MKPNRFVGCKTQEKPRFVCLVKPEKGRCSLLQLLTGAKQAWNIYIQTHRVIGRFSLELTLFTWGRALQGAISETLGTR